jgi:uncharacterized membrane protein
MGAVVAMLAIIRALVGRHDGTWRLGVGLLAAGIAAYLLATAVIIPAFAADGTFDYFSFQALGPNLPSALGNIVVHPWHAIHTFFTPHQKVQTLAYLFLPLALLPLRSRYLLVAVPLLAERFFNSREQLWTTHYHYSAMPWVVLVLAAVDGAARLPVLRWRVLRYALVGWLVLFPFWIIQYDTVTPHTVRRLLNGDAFHATAIAKASEHVTSLIPADVCVAVDDRLAPHLTPRDYVTLADAQYGTADFVALDLNYPDVGNFGPPPKIVLEVVTAYGYTTVYSRSGLILLRSPNYTGPSSACRPFGPGKG